MRFGQDIEGEDGGATAEGHLTIQGIRRAYVQPQLTVYGSLAQLTRRVGKSGHPDGGTGVNSRTGGSSTGNCTGDCTG